MDSGDVIQSLKGIGGKTALLYERLGIYSIGDLLRYYPRTYERYQDEVTVREAADMDSAAVRGVICHVPTVKHVKNMAVVNTTIVDEEGSQLYITWFQMSFLSKTLKKGSCYIFRGRFKNTGKSRCLVQPQIFSLAEYEKIKKTLVPVYGLTAGLTSKAVSKAVKTAFDGRVKMDTAVSDEIRREYDLLDIDKAAYIMHFPKDSQELISARKTIVFEEFYTFLIKVSEMKKSIENRKNHFAIIQKAEIAEFIERLPFALTGAQSRVYNEISSDMCGEHIMNRMVQGDVGSGKTIIAFLAMYQCALCGYQSAMMVPTEVLARQHYKSVAGMIEKYGLGIQAVLLTGSLSASEKKRAYKMIADKEALIVIGTHALIQEKVMFNNLALTVTDEQHRFGVVQREMLSSKGLSPHVLVMSATPIPRSLAIILYGDLDISIIDELPSDRLRIKNCAVNISFRQKAWNFINNEVQKGHQAYVICPLVEESDMMDGCDVESYTSQLDEYYQGSVRVRYVHGKMKADEKDNIMKAFSEHEIDVLVATTVIEVGIDVANATVMLIEDAQHFGLAQLHQLRGRVGRGREQSYCIMIDTSGNGSISERLNILNRSNDGFEIANEDLKLRGPGDFFGIRQSGEMLFNAADIYQDSEILKKAYEAVKKYN